MKTRLLALIVSILAVMEVAGCCTRPAEKKTSDAEYAARIAGMEQRVIQLLLLQDRLELQDYKERTEYLDYAKEHPLTLVNRDLTA
jgi:hypothetical protein